MAKPLDKLMQKEVTRQEFLAITGLSIASIFGLSGIIKMLTGKSLDNHMDTPNDYNSDNYGG